VQQPPYYFIDTAKGDDMNPNTERLIDRLQAGETVHHRGKGNSMIPIIYSGQKQTLKPILYPGRAKALNMKKEEFITRDQLNVGDAVLCKVRGSVFTHLITAIRGEGDDREFQISNNHGRVNGWTRQVYGLCIKVED
jgi:hypothetical protein